MKFRLLFLFITGSFFLKGQTSVYHPMPDSNAVWNFHCSQTCLGITDEYYSITVPSDTVVKGNSYHKLYVAYVMASPTLCVINNAGYKGAYRDDTLMKKVFYVPSSDTTEYLLYDFNLQVGDSVRGYLQSCCGPLDKVISIDSILIGGIYHKRWYVNNNYGIYFIEGIGSTYGLIKPSLGSADGPFYYLDCFQRNGHWQYPDSTASCDQITLMNSVNNDAAQINIFPNPASNKIRLNTEAELKLYDIAGHEILNAKEKEIDVSNLEAGIYFVFVKTTLGASTQKIIVQH